jgi:hypothetical protein
MTSREWGGVGSLEELHHAFLSALEDHVVWHGDVSVKPLDVDFRPHLPRRIRLYLYNMTHPPGGRPLGESKIQLILPGQQKGQRGNFDHSGGRIVILSGYCAEMEVFTLWDAGLYQDFSYSRNVQVKPDTIFAAYAGKVSSQTRDLREGKEIVISARSDQIAEALVQRTKLTLERLIE